MLYIDITSMLMMVGMASPRMVPGIGRPVMRRNWASALAWCSASVKGARSDMKTFPADSRETGAALVYE
jgi:hypothetical protein